MSHLTNVRYFRYEQEIHKRNDGENEFVMLKKVGCATMTAFDWLRFIRTYFLLLTNYKLHTGKMQLHIKYGHQCKLYCSLIKIFLIVCRMWTQATCQKWN